MQSLPGCMSIAVVAFESCIRAEERHPFPPRGCCISWARCPGSAAPHLPSASPAAPLSRVSPGVELHGMGCGGWTCTERGTGGAFGLPVWGRIPLPQCSLPTLSTTGAPTDTQLIPEASPPPLPAGCPDPATPCASPDSRRLPLPVTPARCLSGLASSPLCRIWSHRRFLMALPFLPACPGTAACGRRIWLGPWVPGLGPGSAPAAPCPGQGEFPWDLCLLLQSQLQGVAEVGVPWAAASPSQLSPGTSPLRGSGPRGPGKAGWLSPAVPQLC